MIGLVILNDNLYQENRYEKELFTAIDYLSAYVIMTGNPPATLVLVQNKPTWLIVNQWASVVNIGLFPLKSIA